MKEQINVNQLENDGIIEIEGTQYIVGYAAIVKRYRCCTMTAKNTIRNNKPRRFKYGRNQAYILSELDEIFRPQLREIPWPEEA